MTDLRAAAQQALEALGKMYTPRQPKAEDFDLVLDAITALRAALAQQKQCADESDCTHMPWCRVRKTCQRAAQAKHEPLSVEALGRALVASRVIDAAAIDDPDGYDGGLMLERVRGLHRRLAALAQQEQDTAVHMTHCNQGEWVGVCKYGEENCPALAQQEQEPVAYTGDVARRMREAGMTFHLGMPHAAVMEQMTRFHDIVCAEASIKAAAAFATPPRRETKQEPVAWMVYTQDGKAVCVTDNPADFTDEHRALPLFTHPPRREWQKLSNGEIYTAYITATNQTLRPQDERLALAFARAIEQALKERNT
jgi:hypothetical protein